MRSRIFKTQSALNNFFKTHENGKVIFVVSQAYVNGCQAPIYEVREATPQEILKIKEGETNHDAADT